MPVRRIILDVLVPRDPDVLVYAARLSELEGVDGVNIAVIEQDDRTRTVEVAIEGEDIPFDAVSATIDQIGGSVHSVDQVSAGSRIVTGRQRDSQARA